MSFFSYIRLFYRVEKIERFGQKDASGERGSYDGYVSSFDVFYASSFDVVVTWWKYVEAFKEYVTYYLIPCGLMAIIAVSEVVACGCQQLWA